MAPEKHQSRQKRIYIGKKDPVTGAFLPNKKYYELYGNDADTACIQTNSVIKSVDFGNVYLMEQTSSACGLKQMLKDTFPDCWEDILVCVMHSCMTLHHSLPGTGEAGKTWTSAFHWDGLYTVS